MHKQIVKYFLFYILTINLLFAQESRIKKVFPDNKVNTDKTEYRVYQNLGSNSISTGTRTIEKKVTMDENGNLLISVLKGNLHFYKERRKPLFFNFFSSSSSGSSHQRPEKNLITSFSENIEVGLIGGKYGVISFIPKLNIEPVKFISIYANQNVRYLIPIKTASQYLPLLVVQSAYILGIDNFMNLMFKTQTITQSIAGFIAKNFISSLVCRIIDKDSKLDTYSITNYCYSIKIRL
jgi:hypothetical protein